MASMKRCRTNYVGVFYIEGAAVKGKKAEKIYYIRYRREGRLVEEKAGRQHQDSMTPARAAGLRAERMEGRQPSNRERRRAADAVERRTIDHLWQEYRSCLPASQATGTDAGRYDNYLKRPFGGKEPQELVKIDIDRLRTELLKTLAPQTVKHVLTLLKRIVNYGCGLGWNAPLSFKIEMPSVDNIKTEDLTPEQLRSLFKAMAASPHVTAANMMRMALCTGMRRGELFKLTWDDVDFARGFIHIRQPKGGRSQKIPLNSSARDLLHALPQQPGGYVFPAKDGGQRNDIAKELRAIKQAAGLPADFRPLHGLRHVYATMLASSGRVDMFTLQKLMTHKSPQMTQRYAHYRDEAMQRAANEVSGILDEALSFTGEED